jgi:hypothetical protein
MNPPCNYENTAKNVVFKLLKEKQPRRKTPPYHPPSGTAAPYICLGLALLTSPLLTNVSFHVSDLEEWLKFCLLFQVVMSAHEKRNMAGKYI